MPDCRSDYRRAVILLFYLDYETMKTTRTPLEWAEIFGLGYKEGKRGDEKRGLYIGEEEHKEYIRGYEQGQQDQNKPYEY
jgi:hypothetical protein